MSQVYANKTEFRQKTMQCLGATVLTEPLKMYVVNVVVGGDDTAAVELKADAVCKNGELWMERTGLWVLAFMSLGSSFFFSLLVRVRGGACVLE